MENMDRKIKIKISGVGSDQVQHDGKLNCSYIYVFPQEFPEIKNKDTYVDLLNNNEVRVTNPIILNYEEDYIYNLSPEIGVYPITENGNRYSFYRREYNQYRKFLGYQFDGGIKMPKYKEYTFIGEWKPVAILLNKGILRDFNVTNDRFYQYIIYPSEDKSSRQAFANAKVGYTESNIYGEPVKVKWNEWSLTELIPEETLLDAPVVQKTYKADINNIWLFKYNLETGDQVQNISKNEIQTLGQYPRVAHSLYNSISGNVSCMLGNEIMYYSPEGYIERTYQSIQKPLSTNERTLMLQKWRQLVSSKNPKLLKDMKGQSWIVQIFSSSNTPRNFVYNQPDSISFSWKEIESVENVIIYGDGDTIERDGGPNSKWELVKDSILKGD